MPDLVSILNNAANSLSAQRALQVVASHNIENANTPGYARQRALIVEAAPAEMIRGAFIGRGAFLDTVTQVRDRFVEAQIPAALGSAAGSAAENEALSALHALDPDAAGGIGAGIAGFYAALRGLAQNPGDAGLRTAALGAAVTLARSFNGAAQQIDRSRDALDVKLQGLADEVNAEAQAVARLNEEILEVRGNGGTPNDLLDMRLRHLDRLAELAGATTVPTSEGDVNVVTPGGAVLVAGSRAATLSLAPDPANGNHSRLQIEAIDGSGPSPLSGSAFSGSIGGVLAARDGALRDAQRNVDQLAFDLAGALNAVHRGGYGLDGSTGLDLFAPPAAVDGAALNLAVALQDPSQIAAAASAASLPGDATNAQLLIQTEAAPLPSTGRDLQASLSGIISAFGAQAQRAAAAAVQDQALADRVREMRESASGVSIDEELIEMQKAQRGYEAIIKVIQTADEMLQTLMEIR